MKVDTAKNVNTSINILADACKRIMTEMAVEDSAKAEVNESTVLLMKTDEHLTVTKQ